MELYAVLRVPFDPLLRQFADSGVATTRDVAQYAVKLLEFALGVKKVGEVLGVVIGDDDVRGVHSVHLVSQHEGTLAISVVCNDQALRRHRFQSLRGFASRCSTHVED